jgi:hypothetical protein
MANMDKSYLDHIESSANRYDAGRLYVVIRALLNDEKQSRSLLEKYSIRPNSLPSEDQQLLLNKLGTHLDPSLLKRLCGHGAPLVVCALALIGIERCEHNRVHRSQSSGNRTLADVEKVSVNACIALVVSSRMLQPNEQARRRVDLMEAEQLISIASSFRCLAWDGVQRLLEDLQLRDTFSTLDEEDVLVILDVSDGGDCIGVQNRFELKNRLRNPPRSIQLSRRGAIGDPTQLLGFNS